MKLQVMRPFDEMRRSKQMFSESAAARRTAVGLFGIGGLLGIAGLLAVVDQNAGSTADFCYVQRSAAADP